MRKGLIVIAILLFFIILSGCGKKANVDGAKVDYDELKDMVAEKKDKLQDIQETLSDHETELKELRKLEDDKEDMEDSLKDNKSKLKELKSSIKKKQDKLDMLKGDVIKYKDKPIKLSPGSYYFGDDIDSGRYKVTNQKGYNGNIYFHGEDDFAETFGDGDLSIKDYTFYADDEEKIKGDIPFELYPVDE